MGRDRMERDRPGHGNISECKTHTQKKKKKSFRENKNLKKTIYVKDLKERYPLFRGLPKWLLEKRMACVGWLIFLYAEPNVD